VLICSNVYAPVAQSLSKTLGIADLTIATTAHPFSWAGVTREQIRERATRIFGEVVSGLTVKFEGASSGASTQGARLK
jgi:hypothetical protein